jgi:uncharacterized protein YoxC
VQAWLDANSASVNLCTYATGNATNPCIYSANMWELLYCPYCNETAATTLPAQWGSTITAAISATTVMSAKVTECLLQYETAMQDTLDEIAKNLTYAPVFEMPSSLVTAMADLRQANHQLQTLVTSYMESQTAAATCAAANSIISNMTISLSLGDTALVNAVQDWYNNAIEWMGTVNDIYEASLGDTIKVSAFVAGNVYVSNVLASMYMWLKPTIAVEPTIAIVYKVKNVNQTVGRLRMSIKSLLQNSARYTLNSVLSAVNLDITTAVQDFQEETRVAISQWTDASNSLTALTSAFLNSLVINNDFIGLEYLC